MKFYIFFIFEAASHKLQEYRIDLKATTISECAVKTGEVSSGCTLHNMECSDVTGPANVAYKSAQWPTFIETLQN